jgi:leucyl/phenylalanyl-tRNA--protein transferase
MSAPGRMDPADLQRIVDAVPFPPPSEADVHGLLAWGGDLRPERLISAYAQGIFPWYEEEPILWFSPDPRALLLPGDLVINRTLTKNLRRGLYEVRVDSAFEQVVLRCREVPRPGQEGTWITDDLMAAFVRLHELGFAHSFESWREGELVGGVYGMSLGAAFFGESMFATASDASKVALVALVRQIDAWGFHFLDCQVYNDHTGSMGAREWPRDQFLAGLRRALQEPTRRGAWSLEPGVLNAATAARTTARPSSDRT